jgi:hypothetical protein
MGLWEVSSMLWGRGNPAAEFLHLTVLLMMSEAPCSTRYGRSTALVVI